MPSRGKKVAIAFAGSGESTKRNWEDNLDDWMPQGVEALIVSDDYEDDDTRFTLHEVQRWLSYEFGEDNITYVAPESIVKELQSYDDCDRVLVAIPPADLESQNQEVPGADLRLYFAAEAAGVRILDLTQGLDDLRLPPPWKPEPASEEKKTRSRGKPRTNSKTAEKPSESRTEATVSENTNSELGQAIIAFIDARVDARLRELGLIKPEKTYPAWVSEDGEYRVRGRGRAKRGETAVDLTEDELEKVGLSTDDYS